VTPEVLADVAAALGLPTDEVVVHEAVLSGLREEGLLAGTRNRWTFTPSRPLKEEEVHALAYAAAVAAGLEEEGLVVPWEEVW